MTFSQPFLLQVIDAVLPAGTYRVDVEEELIEGLSFPAYRRIGTWIYSPAVGTTGCAQMILVQPAELAGGHESPRNSAGND